MATVDVYVGEQVHGLMWRRKITNRRMADALGIEETTMSRKLRGQRKWSLEELVRVAGELGVEPGALLPPMPRDGTAAQALGPDGGPSVAGAGFEPATSGTRAQVIDLAARRALRRLGEAAAIGVAVGQ